MSLSRRRLFGLLGAAPAAALAYSPSSSIPIPRGAFRRAMAVFRTSPPPKPTYYDFIQVIEGAQRGIDEVLLKMGLHVEVYDTDRVYCPQIARVYADNIGCAINHPDYLQRAVPYWADEEKECLTRHRALVAQCMAKEDEEERQFVRARKQWLFHHDKSIGRGGAALDCAMTAKEFGL